MFYVVLLPRDLPALAGAPVAVPLVNVASIGAALIRHVEALAAVNVDDLRALHAPALGSAAVPGKLLHVGVVCPAGHRHVEHHAAVLIADGKFVASQADEVPSLVPPTVAPEYLNISPRRPAAGGNVKTPPGIAINDGPAELYSAGGLWSHARWPAW